MRMLQLIARFKLLAQGFLIADIACAFGFQAFQKMQFAIEFHTEGVASGTLCVQSFKGIETWLAIGKLRGIHFLN